MARVRGKINYLKKEQTHIHPFIQIQETYLILEERSEKTLDAKQL